MHQYVAGLVALVAILGLSEGSARGESPLEITTKRDTDSAAVRLAQDEAIISLHSPHGISQAVIHRTTEKWPSHVVLHLHLRGLEHFKVTSGEVTLQAAVSSHESPPTVRQWKDADEQTPLNAQSPYLMKIRPVSKDGKPTTTLPPEDGYFEIQLPQALFEENPKLVTMSWIDFYR